MARVAGGSSGGMKPGAKAEEARVVGRAGEVDVGETRVERAGVEGRESDKREERGEGRSFEGACRCEAGRERPLAESWDDFPLVRR